MAGGLMKLCQKNMSHLKVQSRDFVWYSIHLQHLRLEYFQKQC